jgi:hypothetical protein
MTLWRMILIVGLVACSRTAVTSSAPPPPPAAGPVIHARRYAYGVAASEAYQRATLPRVQLETLRSDGETQLDWEHQQRTHVTGCVAQSTAEYIGARGTPRPAHELQRRWERQMVGGAAAVAVAGARMRVTERADSGADPAIRVVVVVAVSCPTEG